MTARLALDQVCKRFGRVAAVDAVSLAIDAGEVVCLLGPSGCGKSTTLRIAAGLERADRGRVLIDGDEVDGRIFVPPERRSVGLMFQDYALFPHLSVADNVAFGLAGMRADRRARARAALDQVGLSQFARAYPHQLSGGEQQRVALARALAPRPKVLMMDEPFSGLDERLRDRVRDDTLALLKDAGIATLLVTHDPEEAMRMGDRIALMRRGRIVQAGTPAELYENPADRDVAAFFSDLNVLQTVVRDGSAQTPFGSLPAPGYADGALVDVLIRPEALVLRAEGGVGVRVVRVRALGGSTLIEAALPGASRALQVRVQGRGIWRAGAEIGLGLDRTGAFVFPSEGNAHEFRAAAE